VLQNQETQGTFCVSSKKHKNSRVFLIFGWNTKKNSSFFCFFEETPTSTCKNQQNHHKKTQGTPTNQNFWL
jgi:hypothetical protein